MANTSGRKLHQDKALTQMAIKYRPTQGRIADSLFPTITVDKRSDAYNVWSLAEAFRITPAERSPGTRANKIIKSVASATFYAQNYALRRVIPIEDIENMDMDKVQGMRGDAVEDIMDDLMLGFEQRTANLVSSTSNVGSSSGVSSGWSDLTQGNSDPIGDIETGIHNVQDATGYRPNKIVMGLECWRNFRKHGDVVDKIFGNTFPGPNNTVRFATRANAAALFEVAEFMVGESYYNSADDGQDEVLAKLWADDTLIAYVADRPSKDRPSFGYNFRWAKGRLQNLNAKRKYDEDIQAEEVEVGWYQDEKITASACGFLLTACNST